jgi:phosphatidylglycerol:prolipoprotein diacylglycerol transferase
VTFTNTFAHEVAGVPLGVRLHPTQLYESFTTFAIFGLLLWWFPRRKRDGDVFLGYLGLYAVARFFLEFLRGDDDRGFVFNHLLSTSQFIALLALAGVAIVFIWRRVPHAGVAGRQGGLAQAQTTDGGVAASKVQAVAAAHAPKGAKR